MKPGCLTLFGFLTVSALHAEVRTAGPYTILTDITGSAGGRITAGPCTDDASVGGLTGSASVSSPPVADEAGYIAQISDPPAPVSLVVSTAADDGPGSLRAILTIAAARPGADEITFDPALSGSGITLSSQLTVNDTAGVSLDASDLPGGITLDAGGASRVLLVQPGGTATLTGLTITGGNEAGASGGGIYNDGALTLDRCTVAGNFSAVRGGGIYNAHSRALTITRSTITGNQAGQYGGGLENLGTLTLDHVTVAGNVSSGAGGGLDADGASDITISHTIVAGNSAASQPDIGHAAGPVSPTGPNLIGSNQSVEGWFPAGPLVGTATSPRAPQLAPPGDYGGPTRTMPLLPASPARNAATGSATASDQRGFPIVATPDIGAYETGTFADYHIWIWESLPAGASAAAHLAAADFDADGMDNENEWKSLTNPASGASRFAPRSALTGATLTLSFPSAAGRSYQLRQSDTLAPDSWIDAPARPPLEGDGTVLSFSGLPYGGIPHRFYQIVPFLP